MRFFDQRTKVWLLGSAILGWFACGGQDNTKPTPPNKVEVIYSGIKCESPPLMVDLILPLEQRAFCSIEKNVCFDALVQLHPADQKETFSFIILDRGHRDQMKFIEDVLSEAHNSKRKVKITYAPQEGKLCSDASMPLLLEKEIKVLEIAK